VLGDYKGQLDNDGERLVLTDGRGTKVDEVAYADRLPWPVGADALGAGDDWLPADQLPLDRHRFMGRSLERISLDHPGASAANWTASPVDGATPGRRNSAGGQPRAVVVWLSAESAGKGGAIIRRTDEVLVRVRFSALGALAAPSVETFVDDIEREGEPLERIPLARAGAWWEARLPARPEGKVVRYRVVAARGAGRPAEVIAPRDSDPFAFYAYFVSPDLASKTPVYQLYLKTEDWNTLWNNISPGRVPGNGNGTNPFACQVNDLWNARVPAVLVLDGHVYDVRVRYEGSFQGRLGGATIDLVKWPPAVPRPERPNPFRALSWSIKFPRYDRLDGVRSINLNKLTQSCQGFNTLVGNALFERAGIPASRSSYARLYINGAYYHYMLRMEHMDEDFIKRSFGKDIGDLFKSVGGRWDEGPYGYSDERPLGEYCGYTVDQRYEFNYDRSTNEDWKSGGAEVRQLIEALTAARAAGLPAIRKFFEENFAMPELANYLAVINWMVAWDDQYHNHYLYKRAGDGRWMLMPTDMDNMMGGAAPSTADASFFGGQFNVRSNRNDYWNQLKDAYLRAFRAEFIQKVKELDRTVLDPDQVAALVDQLTAQYQPEEAALSPAGVSCGTHTAAIKRLKDFAYARSDRIAAGLFD
jgi:hypothetical protein